MDTKGIGMDFLVRIDTSAILALPDAEREDLVAREQARGRELYAQGILRMLWRLPAEQGNVGIWSAADADELADALRSLPVWPLAKMTVTALATHPLMAALADAKSAH